jgi:hypothetical protein
VTECLLCKRSLTETSAPNLFLHEEAEDCLVRVTDSWGISRDDDYEVIGDDVYVRDSGESTPPPIAYNDDDDAIEIAQFYPIEQAIPRVFKEHGLMHLGGRSSGSGWSNISLFQKCPYAWKRRYLDPLKIEDFGISGEIEPLAIGSLVHVLLAVHYQRMIVHGYPLTPEIINQRVRTWGCNPKVFEEAWRLYTGYRIYYQQEKLQPLAVELDIRDPRNNDSCRFDLVAFFPEERPGLLPGTYGIEHKTAARFDANTLEGWHGNGEVLGQVMLWERLGLHRKYGPLRGVMVNLLGKQKVPEFHRTIVAPTAFTIEQHREDLRRWNGAIAYAKATDNFPRSRNNCIQGYARCELWGHCNSGE